MFQNRRPCLRFSAGARSACGPRCMKRFVPTSSLPSKRPNTLLLMLKQGKCRSWPTGRWDWRPTCISPHQSGGTPTSWCTVAWHRFCSRQKHRRVSRKRWRRLQHLTSRNRDIPISCSVSRRLFGLATSRSAMPKTLKWTLTSLPFRSTCTRAVVLTLRMPSSRRFWCPAFDLAGLEKGGRCLRPWTPRTPSSFRARAFDNACRPAASRRQWSSMSPWQVATVR
mmetsp:Transcript_46698/g.107966  ORF Transcript_46698/g.107966 Transcript_46698/m.107966 type:complete len:224 (-) Transcript_46698:387-1058(-)